MRFTSIGFLVWIGCAGNDGPPVDTGLPTDDTDTSLPTDDTGTDPACASSFTDALDGPSFVAPDGELLVSNEPYYPHVVGAFASGPQVSFHHETERSGACRLSRYTPSTCDPGCAPGTEVCVDAVCVPFPNRFDAGELTLGIDGEPRVLQPDGTNAYFVALASPAEREITLESDGGELAPFSASTCAVAPVVPIGDWDAEADARVPGADLTLSWESPDPGARISLRMITGLGTHGGVSHAEITCEGADTGSLVIDGAFLDELYSEGWACGECGLNYVYRYRSGEAEVDGRSFLLTARAGTPFWHIPGRN